MRLNQNLLDIRSMLGLVNADLEDLWRRANSVVRPPGTRRMSCPLKLSRTVVENKVYHLTKAFDGYRYIAPAIDAADAPDDPGDGGSGAAQDHGSSNHDDSDGPSDDDAVDDGSSDGSDGGGGSGENGGGGGGDEDPKADSELDSVPLSRDDDSVKLMRDYLSSVLETHAYVSLPCLGDDPRIDFPHVYQILGLETRNILVETWKTRLKQPGLFNIRVQSLECWKSFGVDSQETNVFVVEDPAELDVVAFCGADPEVRRNMFVWDACESDVDSCLGLTNPRLLKPPMPLGSPSIPVLTLMDELVSLGFAPVQGRVVHSRETALEFDIRHAPSKRSYYQCVLGREFIWDNGNPSFDSTRMHAYYRLLLNATGPIDVTLTGKALKRKLDELQPADPFKIRVLELRARELAVVAAPAREPDDDVTPDIADVALAHEPPSPVVSSASHKPTSSNTSSDSTSDSSSDSDASASVAGDVAHDDAAIPTVFLGAKVLTEAHKHRPESLGLRVKCTNSAHLGCNKFRQQDLWVGTFGPQAAALFIETWLSRALVMSAAEHKKWRPSISDVRAYIASKA